MRKLRQYYGRLGFVAVPKTDFMVVDPMKAASSLSSTMDPEDEARGVSLSLLLT
jgi:hypothetical protein